MMKEFSNDLIFDLKNKREFIYKKTYKKQNKKQR